MGFSNEQLALAKQLQSGYVTSGTFHSQGQDTKGGSYQQAARRAHPSQPVRTQPPHLRPVNGLVRPLSNNTPTIRSASNTAAKPAPPIQSSAARPHPPPPTARPAPSTARPSSTPSAPAAPAAPAMSLHAHASRPVAKAATTQPAQGSAPPVQPVPPANRSYTRPPPMPTNLQPAMTPIPLYSTTTAPSKPTAPRPSQQSRSSVDSQNAELLKTLSLTSASTTDRQSNPGPTHLSLRNDAVHKAVMQGIQINQMGKPIVWNWASEEPVARELTADEMKEMEEMKKTSSAVESKPESIVKPFVRKLVGLKGSRHAC